jgi:hypothetical protein
MVIDQWSAKSSGKELRDVVVRHDDGCERSCFSLELFACGLLFCRVLRIVTASCAECHACFN